jgi:hypothetical protein
MSTIEFDLCWNPMPNYDGEGRCRLVRFGGHGALFVALFVLLVPPLHCIKMMRQEGTLPRCSPCIPSLFFAYRSTTSGDAHP